VISAPSIWSQEEPITHQTHNNNIWSPEPVTNNLWVPEESKNNHPTIWGPDENLKAHEEKNEPNNTNPTKKKD